MLVLKYGIPESTAFFLLCIPYGIFAVLNPIVGLIIDRIGHRTHLSKLVSLICIVILTGLVLFIAHMY